MPSFNNCGTNITYALMDAYYAGIVLVSEVLLESEAPLSSHRRDDMRPWPCWKDQIKKFQLECSIF